VNLYGPILESNPQRSNVLNADLKLELGRLTLQLSTPYQSRYWSGSLAGETAVDYVPKENQSRVNFYERYLLASYKRASSTSTSVNVRGYFIQFVREFAPLLGGMPSAFLPEGVAFTTKPTGYRAGGSFDGTAQLGVRWNLLYGVEAFHEWMPDTSDETRQGGGAEIDFSSPMNVSSLPFPCPREGMWVGGGAVTTTRLLPGCPLTFLFQSSRSTIGGFGSLQFHPSKRLVLDGGVRLQAAPELRSTDVGYGLTPTFSAAAVYEIATDLHLKLNYAEGFRPPVFNNTNSNGESVQIDGTPDLELETSRAVQFELNGRLLRGRARIRELDLRADYAYTTLDNFITFVDGRYINSSPRGIRSAELLAKLYLQGGARIEMGYTFNRITTSDKGAFVTMPENWFNVMTVNPITRHLDIATALHFYGSFEDPNRRVEARPLTVDENGLPSAVGGSVAVQPYEMVIDREPPAAEVQVALRWRPVEALELQATLYNAFNNRRPAYDNSNDLEARIEITPARFEGFRFFSSATYAF
jgi:outer membrane receptor protein involved in Fe transport